MSTESAAPAPEEKIVLAAIDCIEKQGIQNVTIRGIAKEAGVNSAAINYYFRSKEKLLERAMSTTLNHFFEDWEGIVGSDRESLRARIRDLLDYLLEGALRYPGITRAHLYESLVNNAETNPFVERLANSLASLLERFPPERKNASGVERRRATALRLIQLFSAAMLPALMPGLFRGLAGVDLRDYRTRKSYVDLLVSALPEEPSE